LWPLQTIPPRTSRSIRHPNHNNLRTRPEIHFTVTVSSLQIRTTRSSPWTCSSVIGTT
jgi:hypothetical protein